MAARRFAQIGREEARTLESHIPLASRDRGDELLKGLGASSGSRRARPRRYFMRADGAHLADAPKSR